MKTMYSLINFEVIDRIFNERSEIKLDSKTKSMYINCLMAHFKDKEATVKNAMSFDLFKNKMNNYNRWINSFQKLHEAKLVVINDSYISFINNWGQFIDRSQLDLVEVENIDPICLNDYHKILLNNQSLIQVCSMKNKISLNQTLKLLEVFIKEQEALNTKYSNETEISKHFLYWINSNKDKMDNSKETVKSNSKILGIK